LTGLRIEDNSIRFISMGASPIPSGVILLMGGEAKAIDNALVEVQITGNDIDSEVAGIHLYGGGEDTDGNRVSQIDVVCNRIGGSPAILLTGGRGAGATGNVISEVVLTGNLTGDVLNNVTSEPNTGGAVDNEVDWTVVDQIPEECPITAPSSTASPPPTATPDEPNTAEAADESTETSRTRSDSWPGNWVWIAGGVTLAVAVSWLLRSRIRE
jgi:hypothetical protein